jgi:glycosyltransferase involved in cell wall biosynthesis
MLRIASITDHLWTPSSRFRVRQYRDPLLGYNIELTDFPREYSIESFARTSLSSQARLRSSPASWLGSLEALIQDISHTKSRLRYAMSRDLVWISRELVNNFPPYSFKLPPEYIYDLDDALFLSNPKLQYIKYLTRRALWVFAGNSFIADKLSPWNKRVVVIPPGIDIERFRPSETRVHNDTFVIGWIGTSSSFRYIDQQKKALKGFLSRNSSAQLHICSDRFPHSLSDLGSQVYYTNWKQGLEVEVIRGFSVGIMPLADDAWCRGKCSYKMLQYMACGIPVCVTSVGMNDEVASLGRVGLTCRSSSDWEDALQCLYDSYMRGEEMYIDGPKVIASHFSLARITEKIAKQLNML